MKAQDLSGMRFERLLVVERSLPSKYVEWVCHCDCGARKIVRTCNLKSGNTGSCGCLRDERTRAANTTHGHTKKGARTPGWDTWYNMVRRCTNPKAKYFHHYGGRGITVCKRWLDSFEDFLADMGSRPSAEHSIDRIDVNGHYEPGNCRWADWTTQMRNKRVSVDSITGVHGVDLRRDTGTFRVRLKLHGKEIHVGQFATLEEAVAARADAEKRYWADAASAAE